MRGNGVVYNNGQQEGAARTEEMIRWKRAIVRLGETGENAEERDRLVRVVENVGEISVSGKKAT